MEKNTEILLNGKTSNQFFTATESPLAAQLSRSNHRRMANHPAASSALLATFGTCEIIDAKLERETELLIRGAVGGAIKEAQRDPCGTALKAATAIGVGAVLGVAATAASPWIAGGAIALGAAGTGAWLWSAFNTNDANNRARNAVVAQAVQETWVSRDRAVLDRNVKRLENKIGKDSLDLGLGLLSGGSASRAARVLPGLACREMPAFGFKFFGQSTIARAFPTRVREFELAHDSPQLTELHTGQPTRVTVKEILGRDKTGADLKGPEKSLLIAHRGSAEIVPGSLPKSDLIATCRPELLEPLARARSILQHAADIELQVDTAAGRLRFLTLDKQQKALPFDAFRFDKRFVLGEQPKDMHVGEFVNALRMNKLMDSLQWKTREALKYHNLSEIETGFATLPYRVSGVKGAGAESIVFDLSKSNDAPIFAEESIAPTETVLKISNPKYCEIQDVLGMRPFDARRIGDFTNARRGEYVAYLQEKTEPVNLDDVCEADYLDLARLMWNEKYSFYDGHGDGQLGYTSDGRLVVIDWFAVLQKRQCERPEELLYDFKPTR